MRRSRADARQAILDAARGLLLEEGPAGVRVQRVAAEVGITDAAVHYHFGNHHGLMEALLRHAGRELVAEIRTVHAGPGEQLDLRAVSRALRRAYVDRGAGRMAVWLRFAGWRPRGSGMLSELVAAVHALRIETARARGAPVPSLTDTQYLVTLLNAAHLAQAILGDALLRSVDADGTPAGQRRFLDWVTDWIADHLVS